MSENPPSSITKSIFTNYISPKNSIKIFRRPQNYQAAHAIIVTKNFDPSQFVNNTYNYTHTSEEGNLPACRAKTPPALGQFFKGWKNHPTPTPWRRALAILGLKKGWYLATNYERSGVAFCYIFIWFHSVGSAGSNFKIV